AVEGPGQRIARAVHGRGEERLPLGHDATFHITDAVHRSRLRDEAGRGAARVHPGVGRVGRWRYAGDVESPGLFLVRGEAEALERDPDLDDVARIGEQPARLVVEVGAPVLSAAEHPARGPGT